MSKKANEIQVGGTHYQTKMQVWDFVIKHQIPYMEGTVIKYITRARKKNGIEDLEKAQHYVQKMAECCLPNVHDYADYSDVRAFSQANALLTQEEYIIQILCQWSTIKDLRVAWEMINSMRSQLNPELCRDGTNRAPFGYDGEGV
jgi:hypothetical protein